MLVGDLKKAIKVENSDIQCPARNLQLYPAKMVEGKWLASSSDDVIQLKKGEKTHHVVELMKEDQKLQAEDDIADLLEGMEDPKGKQIHVLVRVPEHAQPNIGLWLVSGSIENALDTKGIRYHLYRLASARCGYYDPALRKEEKDKDVAFWYEAKKLRIHVLFKTEKDAWLFKNALDSDPHTLGSRLSGQIVTCKFTRFEAGYIELHHIQFLDYDSQESDSPQTTLVSVSSSTIRSVLDFASEEYRCMGIEEDWLFYPYGKPESCHMISRKQCNRNKSQYGKFDHDPNNRLALSREMHGFYDGLSLDIPIVNMFPVSVEEKLSNGSRYKVEVLVKVYDVYCTERVFYRLKSGSSRTDDPLVMKTFVYVENPDTFCFCMKWKHDEIEKVWKSFSGRIRLSRIMVN
ncbi:unnamed protein product [Peronospora farinosa]|uniref:Crinkler effector protein N-terminal domain-containing protein n=1 Tax=Peronospora farinosa TaxID=134698 RepID=A0AAV0ST38_9STRA|nr:unnamed protein product [Peronospora farinosa]